MKPIQKDELYEHFGQFLKSRGIELTEGTYSKSIHAGCSLLADAINLSQAGIERAKAGLDKKLDQVRQVIHEKTAPKGPGSNQAAGSPPAATATQSNAKPPRMRKKGKSKSAKRKAKGAKGKAGRG